MRFNDAKEIKTCRQHMKEMSRPFHTFRREHSLRLHPAIFFTHDIFRLDATAVKPIRG